MYSTLRGAAFLLISVLVLLLLFPACGTTEKKEKRAPPKGLPPIMKELRIISRDLKRAILVENKDRYPSLASALLGTARRLESIEAPAEFQRLSAKLIQEAEGLVQAVPGAPIEQMEDLFSGVMGTCMVCHQVFRDG